MSSPLISVIVPVYNAEKYVGQALESMLGQSFRDNEYILINDGSTDGTGEKIEPYLDKDPRIRYYTQHNRGVARTLNRGISLAQGRYLWRHDADDTCEPHQLERQVRFLELHPEVALVGMQVAFMTERGKIARDCRQPKNHWFDNQQYKFVCREDFNPYSPITHATVLVRTDIIKELGGYREAFKTSEDTDLWLRLIEKHKAAVLNECTYFVRQNAISNTKRNSATVDFYRNLAFACYEERQQTGIDKLMAGGAVEEPNIREVKNKSLKSGKKFREDVLNYQYKIAINARDWTQVCRIFRISLRDGWKLSKTWKALLFPWLGERIVQLGVKIKSALR